MPRFLLYAAVALTVPLAARADDVAKATVEKAIKATGWDKRDGPFSAWKGKGTMTAQGQSIEFDGDWKVDAATGRHRMNVKIDFGGQAFDLAFAFDGDKAHEAAAGMERDVTGPKLEYTKGAAHFYRVASLTQLLKDSKFTLTATPVPNVNGKPAVGVKVEYAGKPTTTLSFDKATSLLVKSEATVKNEFDDWKDAVDETYYGDWADAGNGTKEFKSMKVVRGGKTMMELKLSDHVVSKEPEWAKTAFQKP